MSADLLLLVSIAASSTTGASLFDASGAPEASAAPAAPAEVVAEDETALARVRVPWTDPAGDGIGLAYDNGSWGGEWSQGIRLMVPFGDHVAANLRGLIIFDGRDRADAGGRLELIGRSPVFLNLVRLYGGGGIQLFRPVSGVTNPETYIGGGGHFGFEFFLMRRMSWILEVGGQSGYSKDGVGSGATIIAGIQFYPL